MKKDFVSNRQEMIFNDEVGKDYLKLRQMSLDIGLSKATVIPYALKHIFELSQTKKVVKVADLGCSEGSIISKIKDISEVSNVEYYGFDFNKNVIDLAKKHYEGINFFEKDILTDPMEEFLGKFDIILTTNTLHEVFSLYGWNGEFNKHKADNALEKVLAKIYALLSKGGVFINFDGIEHDEPKNKEIIVKLKNKTVEKNMLKFKNEYKPFKTTFKKLSDLRYKTNILSLTRFITKYRFLNSSTWKLEQIESYQYYSQKDFVREFNGIGLRLESINLLAPNIESWSKVLEIETPKIHFPFEHILIIGKK